MAEEIRHPDGRIEHPSVRFERTDARFRTILFIILGTMAFAALIQFVLLVFFYDYRDYQGQIKKSPYPLAPSPSTALPSEPRLEQLNRLSGHEKSDVYLRQRAKEDVLTTYGPTEEEGFVHIPVARAMDLLADKLPARAPVPPDQRRRQGGLVNAGASNSGRMFRE